MSRRYRAIAPRMAMLLATGLVPSCDPADDTSRISSAVTLPVTVTNAMYKIQKTNPDPYHAFSGGAVAISAARNEFEAFQIVIPGLANNVNAIAGDLTCSTGGCAGSRIAAATCSGGVGTGGNVRLYRERYYDQTISSANWSDTHAMLGTLPDALIPQVDEFYNECRAFSFSVASGNNGVIWVDVFVPQNQLAGTYAGNITVTSDQGSATVPVSLEVWDFTLPATASLHSTFGMSGVAIQNEHALAPICDPSNAGLHRRYAAIGLDHRVTLNVLDDECDNTASYVASTYAALFDGTLSTAPEITRLVGARTTSIQYQQGLTDSTALASWAQTMHAHGWFEQLFQYTIDEPSGSGFDNIAPRAMAAHAADPGFRTLVTTDLDEAFAAGVNYNRDINRFVEVIDHLEGTAGNERFEYNDYPQGSGANWEASNSINEVWTYQSCDSHGCGVAGTDRWPSVMIDARPMRNRALEWFSFKNRLKGELYFDVNFAWNGGEWTNQFYFSGHGDGTLLYPGTPSAVPGGSTEAIGGSHHIPIASIRFKLIREGMEDYEYMKLLEGQGQRTFAESEIAAVFPGGAVNTEGDPETLYARRAEMACRILTNLGKPCSGSPPPSCTVDDCFDRSDGALGASWNVVQPAVQIVASKAAATGAGAATAQYLENVGPDQDVSAVCTITVSSGSNCGLMARYTDVDNLYYTYIDTGLQRIDLWRRSAGVVTQLGTASRTLAVGSSYPLRLVVSGSSLAVYFGNESTPAISATDGAIATGNFGGLHGFTGTAGSVTWDDFNITGATSSALFSDTFDRTTGLGAGWNVTAGGGFTTDGAYAVSTTAQNWARIVPSLGTSDYKVTAELIVPAGSLFSGIIARTATINTDETMYAAQLATDGHVNLYRRNAYTWTLLAAQAATITAGVQYTVKLVVSGTSPVHLEVWLNGTQRISFDDSSAGRITAGPPGIENYDSGVKYNSFRVDP
ncbi:MAG: DUF4091 domain-containing protein [Deltaproteobacteria bacterium]|nr:MAG: DUF4091 domain-containing protein [Deltaproteobacteria bacterium]